MLPSSRRPALAAGLVLILLCLPGRSVAEAWLIATKTLEAGPAEVTLPQKVGVLLGSDRRDLAFEVAGRLVSCVEPGAAVAAGDVVARLDATLEEAQLLQASLRLEDAESEVRRLRGLRDAQAASAQRLEAAETAMALRAAEVAVASEQLARRQIVSGVAGEVVETYLEPGEVATPGARIATVMNLDALELELGVPGFQIGDVREGAPVVVHVPAVEASRFTGEVRRVAGATVDGGHLFEVEVVIPNQDRRLRPGMTVRAAIVTETLPNALRVPLQAVVERAGEPVVFFADQGVARAVSLDRATRVGDEMLLPAALPYRDLVVRGQRDLADGAAVRVDNSVLAQAQLP